jgi:SprT protein
MLNSEKIVEVENKIKSVVDKLNAIYKFSMKYPTYQFDVTGTNAGLAKSRSMSVHFNPTLALQNWDDFIDNTIPHEVCHIAVWHWALFFHKHIPGAHGATWKLMMWEVGASAKRTHEYDVSDVKKEVKKYGYKCKCLNPIEVSTIIHNKIKKGFMYKCKKCHTVLKDGERVLNKSFSRPSPNGTTRTQGEDKNDTN